MKLGIFTSKSCSDGNEMHNLKNRDARAKLFFLLNQPIAFLPFLGAVYMERGRS